MDAHGQRLVASQKGNTMYLIRDVFKARPGHAKDLVGKFKQAAPYMRAPGMHGMT